MPQQFHRASTGDTVTVPDVLVDKYKADPEWKLGTGPARPSDGGGNGAELKGADLDAALEAAGLPRTGTADEKRERLTDYANRQENS